MSSPGNHPGTLHFVWKLLHNDQGTLSLLANNPFPVNRRATSAPSCIPLSLHAAGQKGRRLVDARTRGRMAAAALRRFIRNFRKPAGGGRLARIE